MSQTKRIDAELRRRFGERLRAWVDKEHDGNQSAAGRALGVSQSHISAMLSGTRGVGLHFLLLFAGETGSSLDALLGMTGGESEDRMRRILREELAALRAEAAEQPEPAPRPRSAARRPRQHG